MPAPEPFNWDRRRPDPRPGAWPENSRRPHAPPPYRHHQQRRWGNGKQSGWHTYADNDGQGFLPFGSRYNDGNFEEENPQAFSSGGKFNGGYYRNGRENKKPFNPRDWKAPKWKPAESRKSAIVNNLRSTGNPSTQTRYRSNGSSHPPKDCGDVEELMEDGSRKKQRIGWGEGLAKYEKKSVEGPEDGVTENEVVIKRETLHAHYVDIPYKSARVASLSDRAPPSLISCSSSSGLEKQSVNEENCDHDTATLSCSASIASRTPYDGPTYSLQNLEITSITNLSSGINELLQSQDPTSDETDYVRATSMNKLLVWKVDMLKALEVTETQIDSLETEFKSLITQPRVCGRPETTSSTLVEVMPFTCATGTSEFMEGSMNLDMNLAEKCSSNVHSNMDDNYVSILSANKDAANSSMEELNKLLPEKPNSDISIASSICYLERDSSSVKKRFIMRKRRLEFKEKVLAIKFKAFQRFQKEGRLVSTRKHRPKTHKKFGPFQDDQKTEYSSALSRVSSYDGVPQKVLTDEVIEFINRLLSESAFKPYRKTLKMPALIFNKEMKMSRFISNNGLVDDPCAVEKERTMINPWAPEEKEIFIDKLAALGKDFRKIASFLNHKTVADCVEFYYKNHKSDCFEKIRKKSKQTKSLATTYLVASGKRWNRESNAVSLDIGSYGVRIQEKGTSKFFLGAPSSSCRAPRGVDGLLQRSNSMEMDINERETIAVDVLAGISGSLSSEAMSSSCITSCVDHQDWTRPSTHELTKNIDYDDDDDDCSDYSCGELNPTDWTDDEKSMFIDAFSSYGKDFTMISQFIGTKSIDKCKAFFSKTRMILGLDLIQPGGRTVSGDVDGDASDIEDGCISVETQSIICTNNNDSESNIVDNLPPPDMKLNDKSGNVGAKDSRPDVKISKGDNGGLVSLDRMTAESISSNSSKGFSQINLDKENIGVDVALETCNTELQQGDDKKDDLALPNRWSEAGKKVVEVSDGHCGEEENYMKGEQYLDNKTVEERDANSLDRMTAESISSNSSKGFSLINVDNKEKIGVDVAVKTSNTELGQGDDEKDDLALPNRWSDAGKKGVEVSDGHRGEEENCRKGEEYLDNNTVEDRDGNSSEESDISSAMSETKSGPFPAGDVSCPSVNAHPSMHVDEIYAHQEKDINGNISCEKPAPLQYAPNQTKNLHSGLSFEKCNVSGVRSKEVGFSSAVDDKSSTDGVVKLFGQILSSSQQKPNSSVQQSDGDNNSSLKLSSDKQVRLDSSQSKFDNCNNYFGFENIASRSSGFWDGEKIQTGFPPLPDSARLLAKYPDAFSNHALVTMTMSEQPPLQGAVNSPLNGVPVFPPQDVVPDDDMQKNEQR